MFSRDRERVNIFGFVGYMVSVIILNSAIAAEVHVNLCGSILIKLYLPNRL